MGQKRDIIAVAYKTKVSRFNVQNASLIDTDGKGQFIRMLSFLLLDKGRLFFTKFPSRYSKFSSRGGALRLFCNATRQRSF